ncbi:hypothetical protein K1X84_07520 [bacterium]|nr:hypothetical protein [bacterium]
MESSKLSFSVRIITIMSIALIYVACSNQPSQKQNEVADSATAALLVSADSTDGKQDHVIDKCLMCKLTCDGSDNYSSMYAGYTLKFCSNLDKMSFDQDPKQSVLSMKL